MDDQSQTAEAAVVVDTAQPVPVVETPQTSTQPQTPPITQPGHIPFDREKAEKILAKPDIAAEYIKIMIDQGMVASVDRVAALEVENAQAKALAMGLTAEQVAAIPSKDAVGILAVATYTAQQIAAAKATASVQTPGSPVIVEPSKGTPPAAYTPPPAIDTSSVLDLSGKDTREANIALRDYFEAQHKANG